MWIIKIHQNRIFDTFFFLVFLVIEEPFIKAIPNRRIIIENTSLLLRCDANTSNTPSYKWFHQGEHLVGEVSNVLFIQKVSLLSSSSTSSYSCQVSLFGEERQSLPWNFTVSCKRDCNGNFIFKFFFDKTYLVRGKRLARTFIPQRRNLPSSWCNVSVTQYYVIINLIKPDGKLRKNFGGADMYPAHN